MEIDAAQKVLLDDKKAREEACAKDLMDILAKHKCSLDVQMILSPNKHPEMISKLTAK